MQSRVVLQPSEQFNGFGVQQLVVVLQYSCPGVQPRIQLRQFPELEEELEELDPPDELDELLEELSIPPEEELLELEVFITPEEELLV